jgi:NAD(P)-dependent dehydrogenase (short-subunit alcohol dehydrogenase family)
MEYAMPVTKERVVSATPGRAAMAVTGNTVGAGRFAALPVTDPMAAVEHRVPENRRQAFETYAKSASAGRGGRTEEIAGATRFLVSSAFATSVVLPVGGGLRLWPAAL